MADEPVEMQLVWQVVVQGRYGTYKRSTEEMLQMVREEAAQPDGLESITVTPCYVTQDWLDQLP